MNILRLSTLSLTLAIVVFALGYNPSFADKPDPIDGHNHANEPIVTIDYTVELSDGAFGFHHGAVDVTPESEFKLSGDQPVHLIRPGGANIHDHLVCATDPLTDPLCMVWNGVFDLCGLLGPTGMEDVPEFTVSAGRKGWALEKVVDEVWVSFGFPLDSPLSSDPLSVGLRLSGACLDLECGLIPAVNTSKTITLTDYSIHLKGKRGVTHNAACHAGQSPTDSWGDHEISLVIRATEVLAP